MAHCLELFAKLVLLSIQHCLRGMFLSPQSSWGWQEAGRLPRERELKSFLCLWAQGPFLAQSCLPQPPGPAPQEGSCPAGLGPLSPSQLLL